MRVCRILPLCLLVGCLMATGYAQTDTGTPSFEASVPINAYESVNLSNLNILLTAPIRSKGGPIPLSVSVSQNVQLYTDGAGHYLSSAATLPIMADGHFGGTVKEQTVDTVNCPGTQTKTTEKQLVSINDGRNTSHPLPLGLFRDTQNCLDTSAIDAFTTDASGLELVIPAGVGSQGGTVYDRTGMASMGGYGPITDPHGNTVARNGGSSYVDGLTSTPVVTRGAYSSGWTFTYTDGTGTTRNVVVSAPNSSMTPAFSCSGFTNTQTQLDPLLSVSYPDGSAVTLTWEKTGANNYDGRLATLQVPTGATYTHTYSGGTNNDGIWCGTPFGTATMSISNGTGTWTFARNSAGTQTTVTKPDGSKTIYSFYSPSDPVLTSKVSYDTNGTTVLDTWTYCYDSTISACNSSAPLTHPTWVRAYHTVPGVANNAETDTKFDSNGNTLEVDNFDFGPTLVAKHVVVYGSYSNGNCVALSHIISRPCVVQDQDASSNVLTSTAITYTAAGDPQTIYHWNGTTNLTESFVTNSNGTLSSYTGTDGVQATFTNTQCNGFMADSATSPIGTVHMTWDCNSAAPLTTTDLNGLVVTKTYGDPLYRITNVHDSGGQADTNYAYTSPTRFSRDMTFNGGNSIEDSTTTLNSLGQTLSLQKKQSPTSSTYDTVSFFYDPTGHHTGTSQACTTTVGGTCANHAVDLLYDGVNRIKTQTVNTSTHGVLTYTYPAGDINISLTPAPTGENAKTIQIEKDGLGRTLSTCTVTTLAGSGSCGQRSSASGYLTKNTLDPIGRATQVSRNAQAGATPLNENRTFDALSRVSQATIPERGTNNAYFDTVTSPCSMWAASHSITLSVSGGQLAQTTDNAGNVNCYTYESAGRVANIFPISGPNSSATPMSYFCYDHQCGLSNSNTLGRLSAAGTSFSPYTTTTAQQKFAYDVYGRNTDVWQTSPGLSGSYFHTTATWFDNGGLNTVGGIPGSITGFTYGLDGEGRPYSASVGSTSVVSSVSYDPASNPLTVTYGTTDTDTFQYDPNTLNMTQAQFKLNGVTDTLAYTWNPNQTLKTLAITDNISGSGDSQTCNVAHDDLVRVTTDNCGSLWNETYAWSHDDESNVTKSGTLSFAPGYNSANNQFLAPYTYDSNGYLLHDATLGINYTWDSFGNLLSAGTTTAITNDAFGNLIQKTVSGSTGYDIYTPVGLIGGASSLTAFSSGWARLPGGATQSFVGATQYTLHTDLTGSARLATNPSTRTFNQDWSFGPQGEVYVGNQSNSMYEGSFAGGTTTGLFDYLDVHYSGTMGRSISPN